jgi:cyclase
MAIHHQLVTTMHRFILVFLLLFSGYSSAANSLSDVEISTTHLNGSVYMLSGAGGNIGVSAGADGILIVDDQYEPLAEKISAALVDINAKPLKYVINTHYHGDHTGSNAWFYRIKQVTLFAQDNVRKRLLADPKVTAQALPVVTFEQGIKFHFNDETISVIHFPAGHTDGDSVVWFEKANVLHAGDLFFEGRFPYIDLEGGGSLQGYIDNVAKLISQLDDSTKIIPGHGQLADKADYQKFLDMILKTSNYVKQAKTSGLSLEALIAEGLEPQWHSWGWEFISEKRWIETLYKEI